MNQVNRTSLADQAAELLLAKIQSGEWAIGTKLPGETTLAPQLGVGRSTMREAIRQLAGRGILRTRQGSGVFVSSLGDGDEWDLILKRAHINAVLEARLAIEGEGAELAAERRTPSDLETMQSALRLRDERRSRIEELVDADMAFHRSIVAASHNEVLLGLFDNLAPRLRDAMSEMLRLAGQFGGDDDHDAHTLVLDAIIARDALTARQRTRDHLEELARAVSLPK